MGSTWLSEAHLPAATVKALVALLEPVRGGVIVIISCPPPVASFRNDKVVTDYTAFASSPRGIMFRSLCGSLF